MLGATMDRRNFLRLSAALTTGAVLGSALWRDALGELAQGGPSPYGPLLPPDTNGIMLPAGFSVREIARGGQAGITYEMSGPFRRSARA